MSGKKKTIIKIVSSKVKKDLKEQDSKSNDSIIGKIGQYNIVDTRKGKSFVARKARQLKQAVRPDGLTPKLIILHTGTSRPSKTIGTFLSRGTSSNFEVGKDGTIYMYVPDELATAHSGYTNINNISIGVDIAKSPSGDDGPYPQDQVLATRNLVQSLCSKYGIPDVVAPDKRFYEDFKSKYRYGSEKAGAAMAEYFIDQGIGIIYHRNILNKSCPGGFPVEALGRPKQLDLSPDIWDVISAGDDVDPGALGRTKQLDLSPDSKKLSKDPFATKKLAEKKKRDPKVGTGKKPKGSSRRLYTDENPKDTVRVKFSTVQDIRDTLSKASFKSKSHKRQSQIINLIHQRVRAAYRNAKDPKVKKRLKKAFDYAKKRKEASKRKTKRLRKEQTEPFQRAVKKGHKKMKIRLIGLGGGKNTPGTTRPSYKRSKSAPPGFGGSLEEAALQK